MELISALSVIGLGLALLVWSADWFINGAGGLARNFGVPPLLVGLTLVALGTSAPEMLVAIVAALKGNGILALGNALGSNIANIGLVLGVSALIKPLKINAILLRREFPILLLITLVVGVMFKDGYFSHREGMVLLLGTLGLLIYIFYLGLQAKQAKALEMLTPELPSVISTKKASIQLITGLILLPLSAEMFVHGAVTFAHILGVSDLVVGLTVVAIGTSLPELFTSVIGMLKGEDDIVLGNILGSNIFNLLVVLGLPGVIAPTVLPPEIFHRDYVWMLALTSSFFIGSLIKGKPLRLSRWEGIILLFAYVIYLWLLVQSTGTLLNKA